MNKQATLPGDRTTYRIPRTISVMKTKKAGQGGKRVTFEMDCTKPGVKAFQAEGTARTKALRPKHAGTF